MANNLWLNLPVRDLAIASAFYEAIGFTAHPGPGNTPTSASFLIGPEKIVLMLFVREVFSGFTCNPVLDSSAGTEVLFSLGAESRQQVDEWARRAVAAGGTMFTAPADAHGYLYGCGVCDPDGHRWNVLFMDPEEMSKT
jgi:uncharacterized protein